MRCLGLTRPRRFGSRSSGSHASLVLNRTMREGARDAAGSTRTGSASAVHRHRPDAVGWLDWLAVAVGIAYFAAARLALLCWPTLRVLPFLACRRCVRRRPDRLGSRRDGRSLSALRQQPSWRISLRPESLERCSLRFMQCRGSVLTACSLGITSVRIQTEQATQRAGVGSGSDHRTAVSGSAGYSIQIASQHDDADIDDLAALVRVGRTRNNHGCALLIELVSASRDRRR